jgi:hypothetical protein
MISSEPGDLEKGLSFSLERVTGMNSSAAEQRNLG